MSRVKFHGDQQYPLEMHKVRIIQKLNLLPIEERLDALQQAGYNTFLLQNDDVFLDMLTDSGVNAMSDDMQAGMLRADDAYAGSETFYRMNKKLTEIFGIEHFLPKIDAILKTIINRGIALEVNTSSFDLLGDFMPSADLLKRYYDMGGYHFEAWFEHFDAGSHQFEQRQ